ncbi:hypothetical protein CE91St46_26930 [Eubacteriales bacterium]|nr:hypothetical protein CE91St46_26930 [Eubacteriales bacterium]GKH64301.1 hypothetical protein CE91St47_27700 [Eubacteriales bacterium]
MFLQISSRSNQKSKHISHKAGYIQMIALPGGDKGDADTPVVSGRGPDGFCHLGVTANFER